MQVIQLSLHTDDEMKIYQYCISSSLTLLSKSGIKITNFLTYSQELKDLIENVFTAVSVLLKSENESLVAGKHF